MMVRVSLLLAVVLGVGGCANRVGGADGADGATPSRDGWTDLFDGESLAGWHGYGQDAPPAAWSVVDGLLTFTPGTGDGGDLVADGVYDDFELEVEWQIAACGNSGVFYRGAEVPGQAIWATALEMQILDDGCHPDGTYPSHRAGSLYDLYTPTEVAVRPAGAWNTARVVADGDRIEHWLNGRQIVEAEQGSDAWDARLAVSKFRDGDTFPGYGTRRAGLVGLQDHGDTLRVRAVRIRTL